MFTYIQTLALVIISLKNAYKTNRYFGQSSSNPSGKKLYFFSFSDLILVFNYSPENV